MRKLIERFEAVAQLHEANNGKCKDQYVDSDSGRFKGGKGERFDNCVKYMECMGDVEEPDSVCAKIARAKGLAAGQKAEDVEFGPEDMDLILTEGERASNTIIIKVADAMVNSPMAQRYLAKLPLAGYELQLQQTIESVLKQILQSKGVGVSGASQATRAIRGLGRGELPSEE